MTTCLNNDIWKEIVLHRAQAQYVVFQYTRAGEVTPVDGIAHIIPEPATLILLAAGGLLTLPRRRRCA